MNSTVRSVGISLVAIGTGLMFSESGAASPPATPPLLIGAPAAVLAVVSCVGAAYAKPTDRLLLVLALGCTATLVTFGFDVPPLLLIGGCLLALGLAVVSSAVASQATLLAAAAVVAPAATAVEPYWGVFVLGLLAISTTAESVVDRRQRSTETNEDQIIAEPPPDWLSDSEPAPPPETGEPRHTDQSDYVVIESARGRPRWSRLEDQAPPKHFVIPRPGHSYDGYTLDRAVVRCASHVGYRHTVDETERQDNYVVVQNEDGRYLHAIVADGVGSASHASVGAELASSLIARHLVEGRVAEQTLAMLNSEFTTATAALYSDIHVNQFSTTVVVATVNVAEATATLDRVGDSTAFLLRGGQFRPLFPDGEGTRETAALPAANPVVEHAEVTLEAGDVLLLCTDGVAEHLLYSPEAQTTFVDYLQPVPTALDFCRIVGFEARQAHDDQTAVAIWNTRP